mmetsp:Transcript_136190/g.240713  ORF Transcript_136190/g.240713 Transcript_136190/m.240713 type:complete len:178 (+) Transcript_136190:116-649(+)
MGSNVSPCVSPCCSGTDVQQSSITLETRDAFDGKAGSKAVVQTPVEALSCTEEVILDPVNLSAEEEEVEREKMEEAMRCRRRDHTVMHRSAAAAVEAEEQEKEKMASAAAAGRNRDVAADPSVAAADAAAAAAAEEDEQRKINEAQKSRKRAHTVNHSGAAAAVIAFESASPDKPGN